MAARRMSIRASPPAGSVRREAGLSRQAAKRGKRFASRRQPAPQRVLAVHRRVGFQPRRRGHLVSGGIVSSESLDTLTYGDSMTVAASVAAIAYKSYWANTPVTVSYDQSTTTGDTSNADALITSDRAVTVTAKGVAELSALYSDYRVLSSKCTMEYINYAATGIGTAILWGYVQYAHHPRHVRPTDADSIYNCTIPGFKYIYVPNRNTENLQRLELSYDIRKLPAYASQQWQAYSNTTAFSAGTTIALSATPFDLMEGPGARVDLFTSAPSGTVAATASDGGAVPPVEFVFGVCNVADTASELSGRLNAQLVYKVLSAEPADIAADT